MVFYLLSYSLENRVQLRQLLLGRQQLDARRRQLKRQRQPVEARANLGHSRRIVRRQFEFGLACARCMNSAMPG
jgi:hypothetical protein